MSMYRDTLIPQLEQLAHRAAEPEGVEVAWIELKRMRSAWLFRVFIDREDGIDLEDCERVSERLGVLLDAEDPIESSYTLEVSSPGLDRPLFHLRDYQRFCGRLVRLTTCAPLSGQCHFRGRLTAVESETVLIVQNGQSRSIPFPLIESGRLEVELFGELSLGSRAKNRK